DLDGGDVLAGAPDHVLLAIDEMDGAVGAAPHHVAAVEPAAGPGFGSRFPVLEIFTEEAEPRSAAGAADQQLAGNVGANVRASAVHDAHLDLGRRPAAAVGADMPRLFGVDQNGASAGFGHGPAFDQRDAEPGLEWRVQPAIDARAKRELDAMVPI